MMWNSAYKYILLRQTTLLALVLAATPLARAAGSLAKAPYLLYPGVPTQMALHWQYSDTTTDTLAWGTDPSCSGGSVATAEAGASHQHACTLGGLAPATRYYYRLKTDSTLATGSFRSAPALWARNLKFTAYGDTRTDTYDHDRVCAAMAGAFQRDPEYQTFIVHVGDFVDPPDSEWAWSAQFFDPARAGIRAMLAGVPLAGVIGNHEGDGVMFRKYLPFPTATADRFYWSFDYGPAHFTMLDMYDAAAGPSDAQVAWARADLQAARNRGRRWLFMAWHEPAYSAGGHPNNLRAQQVLQPLCEEFGVAIVFNGHNHYYAHCLKNGVHHLTVGGGGAPLYSPVLTPWPAELVVAESTLSYAQVEIRDNALTCTAYRLDGSAIDSFTVVREQAPPSAAAQRSWFGLE